MIVIVTDKELALSQSVLKAVKQIKRGDCQRVDVVDGIKVYSVKDVIRIDINTKRI